jgi:hypothetical protein
MGQAGVLSVAALGSAPVPGCSWGRRGFAVDLEQNQRNSNVVVYATKIVDLYSNYESIIPKVEVAGSIPVSRSKPHI